MAKAKPAKDTRTQHQKFVDTAKEHGADGDVDAFRRAVRSIATAAPMPKPKKGVKKARGGLNDHRRYG
jgi:hypothetical protein